MAVRLLSMVLIDLYDTIWGRGFTHSFLFGDNFWEGCPMLTSSMQCLEYTSFLGEGDFCLGLGALGFLVNCRKDRFLRLLLVFILELDTRRNY